MIGARKYSDAQRKAFDRAVTTGGLSAREAREAAAAGVLGVPAFDMADGTAKDYARKARTDHALRKSGKITNPADLLAVSADTLSKAHAVLCDRAANRAKSRSTNKPVTPEELRDLARAGAAIADLRRAVGPPRGPDVQTPDTTPATDEPRGLLDTLAHDVSTPAPADPTTRAADTTSEPEPHNTTPRQADTADHELVG